MLADVPLDAASIVTYLAIALVSFPILNALYNVYLHPLRNFPGPKLWAASYIPRHYAACKGRMELRIKQLHDEYGEVVRYSPSELSFACEGAWDDIYGFRKQQPLIKDPAWYSPTKLSDGTPSIINADHATHAKIRKHLLPAFSDKALREQEPTITEFVSLFIEKLSDYAAAGDPVDMVRWYNYLIFDLVGYLALGKSFDCLKNGTYHGWVARIFNSIKIGPFVRAVGQYTDVAQLMHMLAPATVKEARARHEAYVNTAANERLMRGAAAETRDFTSYIVQEEGGEAKSSVKLSLTPREFAANCGFLILAGSETTATTLSGATYHLLARPETLARATHEVRSVFSSQAEINFVTVAAQLPYIHACVSEALRIYPPAPNIFPRRTPADTSITVAGYVVPKNTSVGMHQLSINNSARHFHNPGVFAPERWLPETIDGSKSAYYHDNRNVMQPFSIGPRNCLGKNLAWNEMRTVLARMLFNFDLELCEESRKWTEQSVFTFWEKPALLVKLKPRICS